MADHRFDPPYDSPIEETMAWNLSSHCNKTVSIEKQVWIATKRGKFRADLVLRRGAGLPVIVECDGMKYHDAAKDAARDAAILATKQFSAIYRFEGSQIYYHEHDPLLLIAKRDPDLISRRVSASLLCSEAIHDSLEVQLEFWENEPEEVYCIEYCQNKRPSIMTRRSIRL